MHVPLVVERVQWWALHVAHSFDVLLHSDAHAAIVDRHLSRIKGASPPTNPNGVIFFACDVGFMERFGFALISSCYEHARECGIHVHLYEPTPEIIHRLEAIKAAVGDLQLSYTYEDDIDLGDLPERGMYYTAFRFVALRKLLAESKSLFICLDADSLIVNPLPQVVADARQRDVGLYFRLRRRHLNKKIAAFCVIVNHTPGALKFLDFFAAISMKFHRHYIRFRSRFYFDQSALYFSYLACMFGRRTSFYTVGKTVVDYDFGDAAGIWTAKGERKHDPAFVDETRRMMDKRPLQPDWASKRPA